VSAGKKRVAEVNIVSSLLSIIAHPPLKEEGSPIRCDEKSRVSLAATIQITLAPL
jgi:hypothetical protein